MSLKYQRIKKKDESLPAPVRWILRAFSSITLAVCLLTIVCIYGTLTSVPIGQLVQIPAVTLQGLTYLALFAVPFVPLGLLGRRLTRGLSVDRTVVIWVALMTPAAIIGYFIARQGTWGFDPRAMLDESATALKAVGAWVMAAVVTVGVFAALLTPALLLGARIGRRRSTQAQVGWSVGLAVVAMALAAPALYLAMTGIARFELFTETSRTYAATTIYRLPMFEMTELEFYSWWPFQVVLGLFVANLIVATIRRIEFKFVNIGVLTVHSGIIIIAIGSMIYGSVKKEGDTILLMPRAGGEQKSHFYDRNDPAIFLTHEGKEVMIPLTDLPRYNDYEPDENELDIRLHEVPEFRQAFGEDIEVTIPGFYAYAELEDRWGEARGPGPHPDNPRLTYRIEFRDSEFELPVVANDPERRVLRTGLPMDFGILTNVDEDWLEALVTPTEGRHAIAVEVPGEDFREVYSFDGSGGERIEVGDTGYEVSIEQTYEQYPFPVMTEGFEGSQPSAAVVVIHPPDGDPYQRWAIDPYPQLTQDFLPGGEGGRPQRVEPNPEIDITYIDSTRVKILAVRPEGAEPDEFSLVQRLPGGRVNVEPMEVGEGVTIGGELEITVSDFVQSAQKFHVPSKVPAEERDPGQEGVYTNAALPVDISYDADGQDYHERRWLGHLRYVEIPGEHIRPETYHVPGFGEMEVAFGRVREPLPFALELLDFEMIPYEGTGQTDNPIPKDYVSDLKVIYPDGSTETGETRLNNPMVVRAVPLSDALSGEENAMLGRPVGFRDFLSLGKIKVSQAEWDPRNQAFTGLGIGNNAAIRLIAFGAILMSIGIPWAFYVKPAILRARKRKLQREHAAGAARPAGEGKTKRPAPAEQPTPQPARADTDTEPPGPERQHDPTAV